MECSRGQSESPVLGCRQVDSIGSSGGLMTVCIMVLFSLINKAQESDSRVKSW